MTECLTSTVIDAFLAHGLSAEEVARVQAHLSACASCRQEVEAKRVQELPTRSLPIDATPLTVSHLSVPDVDQTVVPGAGLVGQAIAGYELLGEIHRGGQGVVYRAVQKATKRTVALKVLLQGAFASPKQRMRFEREIDLAASLQHPNIVTIHDSGVTPEGLPYCAMQFVEGSSLTEYLQSGSPKPLTDVLQLFVKICAAVHYAHQRGVIHRDLKPGNIRIDPHGEPYVLDFGHAKPIGSMAEEGQLVTMSGEFLGTLAYASPEQVKGDSRRIDIRTDVYSLGVILYEMLTGHYPYPLLGQIADVLHAIAEVEPAPPSAWQRRPNPVSSASVVLPYKIDDALEAIVLKTPTKDPSQRYQSAGALGEDVTHYLACEPISVRPPGLPSLLRNWLRHNFQGFRTALWTVLLGVLLGLSIMGEGILSMQALFVGLANTYGAFPSLDTPLLVRAGASMMPNLATPLYLAPMIVIGLLYYASAGLILVVLVRPKNRWADLTAGLATGLVATVVAFLSWIGPAALLAETVVRSISDLTLVCDGYATQEPVPREGEEVKGHPQSVLVEKYPDLQNVAEKDRGKKLYAKIVCDLTVGCFSGIWWGMLLSVWGFGVPCVGSTLVAGNLLRRRGHLLPILLPYYEIMLPGIALLLLIAVALFERLTGHAITPWVHFCLPILVITGGLRRWFWPFRLALFMLWLMGIVLVSEWVLERFIGDSETSFMGIRLLPLWSLTYGAVCLTIALIAEWHGRRLLRHGANQ